MNVIVYTTPTCPYCYQTKQFLTQKGVRFVEKNVAADHQAAMEMIRISGQQGVPVTSVDGQVVVGFNQPLLMELLNRARPRLGASVADASSQARSPSDLPASGAYVGGVKPGSAAERAGLRKGDVITALAGQPVHGAAELHRLVGSMPAGRDVSILYVRDGKRRETQAHL
jgi:glutaredoxin 3